VLTRAGSTPGPDRPRASASPLDGSIHSHPVKE